MLAIGHYLCMYIVNIVLYFVFTYSYLMGYLYLVPGTHPWHWYITQGLPFVLSTHYLLLILGWKKCKNRSLQLAAFFALCVYRWKLTSYHLNGIFLLKLITVFFMHICIDFGDDVCCHSLLYRIIVATLKIWGSSRWIFYVAVLQLNLYALRSFTEKAADNSLCPDC